MNQNSILVIKRTDTARLPTRGTKYSAGYDLYSPEDAFIKPGQFVIINLGISIRMPRAEDPFVYYGEIHPRSGLNFKHNVISTNGIIDYGYTGPICVKIHNYSDDLFIINKGERVAQLLIKKCLVMNMEEVSEFEDLPQNDRNGGFGSTGL